jgi:hypothetical protein
MTETTGLAICLKCCNLIVKHRSNILGASTFRNATPLRLVQLDRRRWKRKWHSLSWQLGLVHIIILPEFPSA